MRIKILPLKSLLVVGLGLQVLSCSGAVPRANVVSAGVGSDGLIHIRRVRGPEFVAAREKNPILNDDSENMQESVEPPVIATDGRTVGWLVNFPNCCTSYPIPLELVIYKDGKIIRRVTPGRGIFRWGFAEGGRRAAYFTDTLHGNLGPECFLSDLATGKVVDHWSRGSGSLPSWAEMFRQDVGPLDGPQ